MMVVVVVVAAAAAMDGNGEGDTGVCEGSM